MIRTRYGKAMACSAAAIALAMPVTAIAQVQTYSFNIPAQDLASALRQFAQTSRQQVSFNGTAVRGMRSVPLQGAHSVDGGLAILLRGTGLKVRRAGGVLVIHRSEPVLSAVSTQPAAPRSQETAVAPQVPPAEAETRETEIVISGSRIDRPGFESPTPLTRVSAEELGIASRANVGAALADLPQFKAGQSPQTSGTNAQAGRMPVDIRGLGAVRSLVLLDGRRFTSENDLSTIPSVLVKNVDIVTGGASAAWGSGAVAGVVNIQLNHDLTGLRLGVEAGISTEYGDAGQRRVEAAYGTEFDGGRGHFMIGGEYLENDGLMTKTARPNTGRWVLINGTLTPNVGYANAVLGGIVLDVPANGFLRNMGFNPDGSLRTPARGTVSGSNMVGGESPSDDNYSPLATPQKRVAALANISYELTDNLKLTLEGRYSRYWGNYTWFGDHNRGGLTISRDNAFLRPEIKAQMLAAGLTSFTMGRFNLDLAYSTIDLEREAYQTTVALDGNFAGGTWRYGVYFSQGEYQNNIDTPGFRKTVEFANAVDSVIGPGGTPVCRIALADPGTACRPLDLFGYGAPDPDAIAYVTGTPQLRQKTKLYTFGASLRGEPFELPAGPVSIAAGVEARWESIDSRAGALDRARAFTTFQFGELAGKDSVKEAFAEVVIPVVKDVPLLNKLELNGAARYSDYRNSGGIWSWKLGATNEFLPGVVGRVTRSRDIRAPNLSELYTTQTISYVNVADPAKLDPNTGRPITFNTLINGGGNPNLLPEKADTWTAGVTTSPLRGLTASLDYFDITINGVIASIGAQDVVSRCFNGNTALCGRVNRDAAGFLTSVQAFSANLQRYNTNGVDGEIAYTTSLGDDPTKRLHVRVVGTWVNSLTIDDGVIQREYVKNTSYAFVTGMPDWRINGSIGYADNGFNAVVRARYIAPGFYDRNQNITNNRVPAYTYVDLQLSKTIKAGEREIDVYANVSNLFDKDPPIASLFSPFYDTVGRFVIVGARIRL